MAILGYARESTFEQPLDLQRDALRADRRQVCPADVIR